jgi:glycosyltransferase involved in cell wall biosynthesis
VIRVLVIDHVTTQSGGEIALLRVLRALDKRRFDVVVALPDADGMLPLALSRVDGVRIRVVAVSATLLATRRFDAASGWIRWPMLGLSFLAAIWRHVRVIREERAHVVLTNSIKSDYYGTVAALLAGRRIVWYLHDLVDHHYFPGWASQSLAWTARCADHILCNSAASRDALVALGLNRSKLSIAYPTVGWSEIQSVRPADLRRELGLDPTTRFVTMVGRITPPKGQLDFVAAVTLVRQRVPEAVFLVVGDAAFGSYDDEYKRLFLEAVRQQPDPNAIRWLGAREDALGIIASSDVVVFPSRWPEGFGLVVAEAMAIGTPVVATALGGTAELVEDGVTGLRIPPDDPERMALAIVQLLINEDRARRMVTAARARIADLSRGDVAVVEAALAGDLA